MKKILITTSSFGEYSQAPIEELEKEGFKIIINPFKRKLNLEESLQLYTKDIDGVIAGTEDISKQILEQATNLKVISRCGVGIDNIDFDAAKNKNIQLYNTPDGPTLAVAELTVGLMLNLFRKVSIMNAALKAGRWDKLMGNLLYNKKIGIIGFGRIGQKVAEILSVFKTELAYYDIASKPSVSNCIPKGIDEILAWADIITLHLSPSEDANPFLSNKELRLMKKGSWLINVSRGGVVDEQALYECLKDGHIAGAALDVFKQEPYSGPIKELDNVILTPHAGSYAKEARIKMEIEAVDNLIRGFKEKGEI